LRTKNVKKILFLRLITGIVPVAVWKGKLKLKNWVKFDDFADYSESNDYFVPI